MGGRGRLVTVAAVVALAGAVFTGAPANAEGQAGIDWKPCPDVEGVDCGAVTVPVDWAHPGRGTVKIALARRKATDPAARIGSILMDPGGPGGSGVSKVRDENWTLSPEITKRFDTVGFDPRGIGDSTQIQCGLDEVIADYPKVPKNQKEFEQLSEYNRKVGESCDRITGPLARLGDTRSVARDMDAIRAALGDKKLTYYGVSYGSLMGQQYAELFPDRIRALVLDSNLDHSITSPAEFLRSETEAVQESFTQFAAWCDRTPACALHGQDVPALLRGLQDRAERGELTDPSSEEPITPFDLAGIVHTRLTVPAWTSLATRLANLRGGAATSQAARLDADIPVNTVSQSIFCADWRFPVKNFAELESYRKSAAAAAPDVRMSVLGWASLTGCIGWPAKTTNPQHPLSINGAPPLLMLNGRYDPATPLAWAKTAARQSGTTLLTYDGWGHGAYFKNSECVVKATDAYLISGKLPARGTHCAGVEPAATPPPGSGSISF